ncbi:hypothetical protein [Dehalobacter sp. TeCB1]|uniref:hypothetical protein n=1 Tax=Dehalobacter sp. TeCB1 TaxID=1843715 RepID=UPI00083AD848|nr:hypothetical protein [Dehalobacter sp. TeCB1]OCZ50852.1 hypothetical protein A7D23_14235 [Dehalobacter sp. TeCB1]
MMIQFNYEEAELINGLCDEADPSPTLNGIVTRLETITVDDEGLIPIVKSTISKLQLFNNETFRNILNDLPLDTFKMYPTL